MNPIGFIKPIRPEYVQFFIHMRQDPTYTLNEDLTLFIKGKETKDQIKSILNRTLSNQDDESLFRFQSFSISNQAFYYYALSCLAYPFFRDTVEYIGKQFRLHEHVTTRQVQHYLKSIYGNRRRVEVAVASVLSTLHYWNLIDRPKIGVYSKVIHEIDFKFHIALMIEVLMQSANNSSISKETLEYNSIFFPFHYDVTISDVKEENYRVIPTIRDTIIERA